MQQEHGGNWAYHRMEGMLEFWFNADEAEVFIKEHA